MANDTKQTTPAGASGAPSNGPQPATLKQLRDASNAIVDALQTLGREDQLRALESATSLLGLRRKPSVTPNTQSGSGPNRGGSR